MAHLRSGTGTATLTARPPVDRASRGHTDRTGHHALRRGWRKVRRRGASYGHSLPGVFLAVMSFCLSLTPSLLPRTVVQQGLIGGVSAGLGYGTGTLLGVAAVWLTPRRHRRLVRRAGRWALIMAAPPLIAVALYRGFGWQQDIHRMMGAQPPPPYTYAGVPILSAALFVALVTVVRGLWTVALIITGWLRRWVPQRGAQVVALLVVVFVSFGVLNEVIYDGGTAIVTSMARTADAGTIPGASMPVGATRSGSAQSLANWGSLGREGRSFVSGGPRPQALTRFSGRPAKGPVRVYVGLATAPTLAQRAEVAVKELERTRAFTRRVLCVITTTGTGWIDPKAAAALEYLYNGDTALVGIQYSYQPSWSSFLIEKGRPAAAGRELFDRVYARWSRLSSGRRPRLLVLAESLGALGSEAAFTGVDDIRRRTDGVLWIGPTNANPLWTYLTAHRDPGSPQRLPTYRGGRDVRFAATTADLDRPQGQPPPAVVYLQRPSDPVVWWSPRLMIHRPDWLAETRGADVLPDMRWYPFVTFFQVTTDLKAAYSAPAAHGHRYGDLIVAAWAAVAAPDGWTPERTRALTAVIAPRR